MDDPDAGWTEADSEHFIDLGQVYIPCRQEIGEVILDLIPAESDESFPAIDLGIGAGWPSRDPCHNPPVVPGCDGG